MRRVAKSLGKYIPTDLDDEYLADAYSDVILDWRSKWVDRYYVRTHDSNIEEIYAKELDTEYANWEKILGDRNGPYIFGEEIIYVDFMFFSMMKEDTDFNARAKEFPNIDKFMKAFEARPTLQGKFI
jgi:glutathione S-transferase